MKYASGFNLDPEDALGLVQSFVSMIGELVVDGERRRVISPDGEIVLEVRLRLSTEEERRHAVIQ